MPAVEYLYKSELKRNNIKIIGISQFNTTESDSIEFVRRHDLTFPNIYDPTDQVSTSYDVTGVPTYVFIDKQGNIVSRSSGAKGVDSIHTRLKKLLSE